MSHVVFISYSSKKLKTAQAVCAALKKDGILALGGSVSQGTTTISIEDVKIWYLSDLRNN
jgi:hypothetical protein